MAEVIETSTARVSRYALILIGIVLVALGLFLIVPRTAVLLFPPFWPFLLISIGIGTVAMVCGLCSIVLGIMDWSPAAREKGPSR